MRVLILRDILSVGDIVYILSFSEKFQRRPTCSPLWEVHCSPVLPVVCMYLSSLPSYLHCGVPLVGKGRQPGHDGTFL